MVPKEKLFLETSHTQAEVTRILTEKTSYAMEYFTYNVRRYKVPVTLVLVYTRHNVTEMLKKQIRLSDVVIDIKLGDAHFFFIFLPFTDEDGSYSFIKHLEHTRLANLEHFYYFEKLPGDVHNTFNYINSFLFQISDKIEHGGLHKPVG